MAIRVLLQRQVELSLCIKHLTQNLEYEDEAIESFLGVLKFHRLANAIKLSFYVAHNIDDPQEES